jgi:hypothetical protein
MFAPGPEAELELVSERMQELASMGRRKVVLVSVLELGLVLVLS